MPKGRFEHHNILPSGYNICNLSPSDVRDDAVVLHKTSFLCPMLSLYHIKHKLPAFTFKSFRCPISILPVLSYIVTMAAVASTLPRMATFIIQRLNFQKSNLVLSLNLPFRCKELPVNIHRGIPAARAGHAFYINQ